MVHLRLSLLCFYISARSSVRGDVASPCSVDEQVAEVQDVDGLVCTAACNQEALSCPASLSRGWTSRPMCMLRDTKDTAHCALLCSKTSECPDGTRCLPIPGIQVNVCTHTASFDEWANMASSRIQKMTFGLPAGLAHAAALQKGKAVIDNLKLRYSIPDIDPDLSIIKDGISSIIAANSVELLKLTMFSLLSGHGRGNGLGFQSWKSDFDYAAQRLREGPGGLTKDLRDTMHDLDNLGQYGSATHLFRAAVELIVVYLAVGALYKSQALGATGLDMIPHIGFWRQYPDLVKDGIAYAQLLIQGRSYSLEAQPSFGGYARQVPQAPMRSASSSKLDSYEQLL